MAVFYEYEYRNKRKNIHPCPRWPKFPGAKFPVAQVPSGPSSRWPKVSWPKFTRPPSHPEVQNHYPSGPGWGTRLLIKLITIATPASSCLLIQVYNAYFFTFGILFGNPFGVVHNFVDQWQILIHTVGSEAIKSDGLRIAVSRLLPTTN